jgi:hypothetical protein
MGTLPGEAAHQQIFDFYLPTVGISGTRQFVHYYAILILT